MIMSDEHGYHFIDTNVFLSIVLENTSKYICKKYFEYTSEKFTSGKVRMESHNVIFKLYNLSSNIVDSIKEYVQLNNIPDVDVVNHINIIKRNFLNKYSNEQFPFGFKKRKFNDIVNEYFHCIKDEFYKYSYYNSSTSFE